MAAPTACKVVPVEIVTGLQPPSPEVKYCVPLIGSPMELTDTTCELQVVRSDIVMYPSETGAGWHELVLTSTTGCVHPESRKLPPSGDPGIQRLPSEVSVHAHEAFSIES